MSSDQLIAVMSDAMCGLLQAAMPSGCSVVLAAPHDEGQDGLALHLFRITQPPLARASPVIGADGRRLRQATNVHLDYLITGPANDPLHAHALLGTALRALGEVYVFDEASLQPFLSQPQRLQSLDAKTLLVQLRTLDLPLAEQAAVWSACGAKQRAGVFWRVEANWEANDIANGPRAPVRDSGGLV